MSKIVTNILEFILIGLFMLLMLSLFLIADKLKILTISNLDKTTTMYEYASDPYIILYGLIIFYLIGKVYNYIWYKAYISKF